MIKHNTNALINAAHAAMIAADRPRAEVVGFLRAALQAYMLGDYNRVARLAEVALVRAGGLS